MRESREYVDEVFILGVSIEAWADFAIVEMAVSVDGNRVFHQKSQEERAECGFLFRGTGVGGYTSIIETTYIGHADGFLIVATAVVYDVGNVVCPKYGAVLEDDEVVTQMSSSLVAHEVGGFHLAVWAIASAVDDDFRYLAHRGRYGVLGVAKWSRGSLICSQCRRWKP